MKIEVWPIGRLLPYQKNARVIPQSAIDKVAASLKEFGWQQPVVVEQNGEIVAGHTRRLAAIKLGLSEVPVYVARNLTKDQIKAFRLADNKTAMESSWDEKILASELMDLNSINFDLSLTGFEMPEVADVVSELFGGATSGKGKGKKKLPGEKDGRLVFRVIVDAKDEKHQAELLKKFKTDGLKAKALIS